MKILSVLLVLILVGCAPTAIMLKNEKTGQVAECEGVGFFTWGGAYRLGEQDECIRRWEKSGFKRES